MYFRLVNGTYILQCDSIPPLESPYPSIYGTHCRSGKTMYWAKIMAESIRKWKEEGGAVEIEEGIVYFKKLDKLKKCDNLSNEQET